MQAWSDLDISVPQGSTAPISSTSQVTRDELWSSTQENFALDDDSEPDEAALKSKATLEKNLADADQDKDGKITRDELHSFIEKSRKILEVLAEADEEGDEEGDDDEEDDDE